MEPSGVAQRSGRPARARAGAPWGLLAGLILGGRKSECINRDLVKKPAASLVPGTAALFMLISAEDEPAIKRLTSFHVPLHTTPLTGDVEEAVEQATVHKDLLAAIKYDVLE